MWVALLHWIFTLPRASSYSFNVLQPYLAQDRVAGSFIIAANDGQ